MSDIPSERDQIFPRGTGKSYALVELVRGESPSVDKGPDDTVFSFPIVLLWEILLFLGVTLLVFLFSLVKQAPLDSIANPQITIDPAKAPWYFVGLQELLEHMHPTLAGVIIPSALVLFLVSLPYLDQSRANVGVWFTNKRGRRIAAWSALYTFVVMTAYIVIDNAFSLRELLRGTAPQWIAQGLLPALILGILVAIPVVFLRLRKASPREFIMALFTVMVASAIVMTVSGFLFRGPGFKLFWPWEMPNGYNPWDEF
jgi:quinol-cytochrome oxidoreductase complex cytochrome b subunit